jgi:hypothetical protein
MEYRHGPPEDTFLRDTGPRSRPTLEASRADRHAGRETCQRPGGRHGSTKRKALQGQVSGREGISDQPPCPPWSRYQLPGGYWLSGTGTDRAAACRLICYSGNRNCPDCLGKLALQQIAQHARCLQPRLAPNPSNPRRSQPVQGSQPGRSVCAGPPGRASCAQNDSACSMTVMAAGSGGGAFWYTKDGCMEGLPFAMNSFDTRYISSIHSLQRENWWWRRGLVNIAFTALRCLRQTEQRLGWSGPTALGWTR